MFTNWQGQRPNAFGGGMGGDTGNGGTMAGGPMQQPQMPMGNRAQQEFGYMPGSMAGASAMGQPGSAFGGQSNMMAPAPRPMAPPMLRPPQQFSPMAPAPMPPQQYSPMAPAMPPPQVPPMGGGTMAGGAGGMNTSLPPMGGGAQFSPMAPAMPPPQQYSPIGQQPQQMIGRLGGGNMRPMAGGMFGMGGRR